MTTNNHSNTIDENGGYYSIADFSGRYENKSRCAFTIIHLNIRSYSKNSEEFHILLDTLKMTPDVIVITETWFSSNYSADLFGYRSYHIFRGDRRGGGVSIYVKNTHVSKLVPQLSFIGENMEICSVKVSTGDDGVIIHGVYRPPDRDLPTFTVGMMNIISRSVRKQHTLVIGDLNIDMIAPTQTEVELIDAFYTSSFIPLITVPTHVTRNRASCLDHIWYNQLHEVQAGVFNTDISDHFPIFAIIPLNCNSENFFIKRFRDHSERSIDYLRNEMCMLCDNFLMLLGEDFFDVNSAVQLFNDSVYNIYNKCCPIRSKRISYKRFSKPWITDHLKVFINRKHSLYKQYRRGFVTFQVYNNYKNQVTHMLRREKENFFINKFNAKMQDVGETWKIINSLIKNKRNLHPDIEIVSDHGIVKNNVDVANHFNNYFVNVAANLESKIPAPVLSPLEYMGDRVTSSFFVLPVSSEDVRTEIMKLKCKSCNLESVPPYIYKLCESSLTIIIARLFNLSVVHGIFPECLKTSRVIPVFKRGDKTSMNNYRPISTLPIMSKLFEKLMKKQLCNFLTYSDILTPCQFGFRQNSSTSDAILEFLHSTVNSLDSGDCIIATYLDFAKAFDTVRHDVLLDKLEHLGVRGIILDWFRSYLSGRYQYVNVGDSSSALRRITSGVPQGSVLGPTLFLLYINDMARCSERLKFVHFADDTTVFCSGRDIEEASVCMNDELKRLVAWLRDNRLILNTDKTSYMIFSDVNNFHVPDIRISNNTINQVEVANFLGVKIDCKLTFKAHIDDLCNSVSRSVGIINKISSMVPPASKKLLYYALIYSKVSYGILAWGRSSLSNTNRVGKLLDRAKRIVSYSPNGLVGSCGDMLNFESMYHYFSCIKMFKIVKSGQHPYFNNILNHLVPQHAHRTRFSMCDSFNTPFYHKSKSQKGFLYQSISNWNTLPADIKSCQTLDSFKRGLKKYLISK